ncbi:MAG: hypothetical protein OEO23_14730, partial [Gemmatimonadota bacterium]|nr:hypothetical protein [Gemmatimonadota bacterium]
TAPMETMDLPADEAIAVSAPTFALTTTDGMTALRWAEPLASDVHVERTMDEAGGSLFVKPGVGLVIPKYALGDDEDITITSKAGEDVAFEFGPHGLHFKRMVSVRISVSALANQDEILKLAKQAMRWSLSDNGTRIELGSLTAIYYAEQDGELVEVIESFPVFLVDGAYLEFETEHFSGYALAA